MREDVGSLIGEFSVDAWRPIGLCRGLVDRFDALDQHRLGIGLEYPSVNPPKLELSNRMLVCAAATATLKSPSRDNCQKPPEELHSCLS